MIFLAGLMDWVGTDPPTASDLLGHRVVDIGWAHVKLVEHNGGSLLGHSELDPVRDGLVDAHQVSHRRGGTVWLYEGATILRPATYEEAARLPTRNTWGYLLISALAERRFVSASPS
jgi:hypothetical protein